MPVPIGRVRMSASSGLEPAFAHNAVGRDLAGHRKPERQIRAFARMATDQRHALAIETGARAGQKLEQILLHLCRSACRYHRGGERIARCAAHGEHVVERMIGGDLAEHIGVIDEGTEKVDGLHQVLSGRRDQHRGVVGCGKPDNHIG